jgi:D-beta-D-heptose 7-phosphate kinase/D-beta-D-heptose 1-phosphate adenosyltransferase
VVRKPGTATVSRAELLHKLAPKPKESLPQPSFQGTAGKTVALDRLLPQLDSARKAGSKIIFTNGCFDILHAGHVQLLEAAKMLGGTLVVGLNTDESVTGLKGQKRPVITQARRARVLSALNCVDFVVLFDAPTPIDLITKIKPDILVKGADYVGREVVGRELVEQWSGKVELLPLLYGVSTTSILEKAMNMEAKVKK